MLQAPEAESQTWKVMPFKAVVPGESKVNVQVVAVLPAEEPSVSLRVVMAAAFAVAGIINTLPTKNRARSRWDNRDKCSFFIVKMLLLLYKLVLCCRRPLLYRYQC